MVVTRLLWTVPCILAASQLVQASTKGVAPEKLELYRPDSKQQWTCLDGSKTIPFSAVNDDFCDCPDGSDEPGTSACPNGYYYCENKGHIPAYIKSWMVDDGVCDESCCDGSDESSGLRHCPNRCEQAAAEYQKTQAEVNRLTSQGYALKKKLIQEAQAVVQGWEEEKYKLDDLLVVKRAELERYQREVDAMDKEQQHQGQTDSDKRAPRFAKQQPSARQQVLETRVKQLRDEIDLLLSILADMKRDHNHNFHDMAVKTAIAGYDEFLIEYNQLRQDMDRLDEELTEENEIYDDEGDDDDDNDDEAHDSEHPTEHTAEAEGKQPSTISKKVLGKLNEVLPSSWKARIFSNGQGQKSDGDDGESELDRIRQLRDGVDAEVKSLETKVKDINDKLNYDFGKQREWLKLQDTCVEKDDGEYVYSLCLLGGASQKSNKDGSNINLGHFEKFVGHENGGDDTYTHHAHTHGLRCWNGPERSVRAIFECGDVTEILDVMEPEKCEYHFRLRTPAVCPNPDDDATPPPPPTHKVSPHVHEEL